MKSNKLFITALIFSITSFAFAGTIYDKSNPNYDGSATAPEEVPKDYEANPSNNDKDPFVDITVELVKEVQLKLAGKGYDVGQKNGILNPKTRQSLMTFQKKFDIQPTGSLNRETLRKMGIAIPAKNTQKTSYGE